MSSSVQFNSGNTRINSPDRMRMLNKFHSSGRYSRGSQECARERNENTPSLARLISSRRAMLGCIKLISVERLLKRLGLHRVGIEL